MSLLREKGRFYEFYKSLLREKGRYYEFYKSLLREKGRYNEFYKSLLREKGRYNEKKVVFTSFTGRYNEKNVVITRNLIVITTLKSHYYEEKLYYRRIVMRDFKWEDNMRRAKLENLLKLYFDIGLSYPEILSFLAINHHVVISMSTLKRILKSLRLSRKTGYSDILDVALFITGELETSGKLHGYRWMHQKCIQSGFNIPRDTVYDLLKLLDHEGVFHRKRQRLRRRQYISKGPNFVWHIDGYDKLKPYGIAIHGCIDGFSRNIIWLEAHTTNNDPKVIAHYFIEAVRRREGCPQRIRADMGTENAYIEQMQVFLRRNHGDDLSGNNSFLYGKSTHNQRIEWFWGCLRKEMGQFWMDFFADFASEAGLHLFCGDFLDKSLIQFCFMKLIQEELDTLAATWNTHRIASRTNAVRGGNRPLMMYTLPELYNVDDRLCPVDEDEIEMCAEETSPKPTVPCDETVAELCCDIMKEYGFVSQNDATGAKQLYQDLRGIVRSLL